MGFLQGISSPDSTGESVASPCFVHHELDAEILAHELV